VGQRYSSPRAFALVGNSCGMSRLAPMRILKAKGLDHIRPVRSSRLPVCSSYGRARHDRYQVIQFLNFDSVGQNTANNTGYKSRWMIP
jgi:hypothetical protein